MNKSFNIIPLVCAGGIKFGMKRSKVRELLGNYSEYKNHPEDTNTADCFDVCHVFYSEADDAEFIMFHALDKIELLWNGEVLTAKSKNELVSFFAGLDETLSVEDYGQGAISIESNELGVACYFSEDIDFDEEGNETAIDKVETISVAVKNYWK
jgi:hypothetical protein